MDFDVSTDALRRYRTDLHAWSGDVSAAEAYVWAHATLAWSDAMMFQPVVQINQSVVSALNAALARIKDVLETSGIELGAAATLYDQTDATAASRSDRGYEAVRTAAGTSYADHHSPDVDTVPKPPEPPPPPPPESGPPTGTTTTTTTVPAPAAGPAATPSPSPSPSPGPAPTPTAPPTGTTTTTTPAPPPTTVPNGPPTGGGR